MCRLLSITSDEVATTINKQGNTINEAIRAKKIITAVSCPYAANIGIGAKPSIANPTTLDAADAAKATPVPRAVALMASMALLLCLSSFLNRSVICIE